jgi:hypothetical protein
MEGHEIYRFIDEFTPDEIRQAKDLWRAYAGRGDLIEFTADEKRSDLRLFDNQVLQNDFPDHAGRPGQVGGSLPRESGGASGLDFNKSNNISIAGAEAERLGMKVTTTSLTKVPKDEPASYNNVTGEIFINPRAGYWKDPKGNASKIHKAGWWSSSNPLHPVYHEHGHEKFDPPINWNGGRDAALRVSKYAAVNPREFVSEVYAGLRDGQTYDEEVMRFYDFYARERK